MSESKEYINKYEQWLWAVTKFELDGNAKFNDKNLSFKLKKQPYPDKIFPTESFKLGKPNTEAHVYRMGHPLAQYILEKVKEKKLKPSSVTFDLTGYEGNVSILNELKGKSGWLSVIAISVNHVSNQSAINPFLYLRIELGISEFKAYLQKNSTSFCLINHFLRVRQV